VTTHHSISPLKTCAIYPQKFHFGTITGTEPKVQAADPSSREKLPLTGMCVCVAA